MKKNLLFALFTLLVMPLTVVAAGGRVIAGDGVEVSVFVSGSGITSIDLTTGNTRWRVLADRQFHEPVLAGGQLLAAGSTGLYAIDPSSGEIGWMLADGTHFFPPVVVGGEVFVTNQSGMVRSVDLGTGEPRWQRLLGDGWLYPPAVIGSLLITGGQSAQLRALDRRTGEIVWQKHIGQELVYSPVVVGNGRVVVTTFSGEVTALNAASGEALWSRRFPSPSLSPVLIDGRLVIGSLGGVLRAIDPVNGKLIWRRKLESRLIAPVQGVGGHLLALTNDSHYHIVDGGSGQVISRGLVSGEMVGGLLLSPTVGRIVTSGREGDLHLSEIHIGI
ncbi:MAG: PQQ-binding-like beta-propeller repeat protein [Candidatus Sedimenticola sp. (ex Thyasira tokunagai)]